MRWELGRKEEEEELSRKGWEVVRLIRSLRREIAEEEEDLAGRLAGGREEEWAWGILRKVQVQEGTSLAVQAIQEEEEVHRNRRVQADQGSLEEVEGSEEDREETEHRREAEVDRMSGREKERE